MKQITLARERSWSEGTKQMLSDGSDSTAFRFSDEVLHVYHPCRFAPDAVGLGHIEKYAQDTNSLRDSMERDPVTISLKSIDAKVYLAPILRTGTDIFLENGRAFHAVFSSKSYVPGSTLQLLRIRNGAYCPFPKSIPARLLKNRISDEFRARYDSANIDIAYANIKILPTLGSAEITVVVTDLAAEISGASGLPMHLVPLHKRSYARFNRA